MSLTLRQQEIMGIVDAQQQVSISTIKELLHSNPSIPTINRDMAKLGEVGYLKKLGAGRSTTYAITLNYKLFAPINASDYFELEPDKRRANDTFDDELFQSLADISIFTHEELTFLKQLQKEYQTNVTI